MCVRILLVCLPALACCAAGEPQNSTCFGKTCAPGRNGILLLQTSSAANVSSHSQRLPGVPQDLQDDAVELLRQHRDVLGLLADQEFAAAEMRTQENLFEALSKSASLAQEEGKVQRKFFESRRRSRRRRRSAQYSAQKKCAFFMTRDVAFGASGGWKMIGHNGGTCDDLDGDYVDAKEASSGIFFVAPSCSMIVYDSANCAGSSKTITSGSSSRPGIYGTNDLSLTGWNDKIASIKCSC
eukprot:TRINITY_DN76440_c0_g1_i1.p1 TRINITY_DN76440_c0_g1~~TRINITY_DN76440_c0_g1_i1.p1  ORF type:complete len:240 (+),score=41.51 TRINITY_DN76440_c0_g1_i1:63-782(+)